MTPPSSPAVSLLWQRVATLPRTCHRCAISPFPLPISPLQTGKARPRPGTGSQADRGIDPAKPLRQIEGENFPLPSMLDPISVPRASTPPQARFPRGGGDLPLKFGLGGASSRAGLCIRPSDIARRRASFPRSRPSRTRKRLRTLPVARGCRLPGPGHGARGANRRRGQFRPCVSGRQGVPLATRAGNCHVAAVSPERPGSSRLLIISPMLACVPASEPGKDRPSVLEGKDARM